MARQKGDALMRRSIRRSRLQGSQAPAAPLPSLRRCLVLFGTGAILAALLTPVIGVGVAAASSVSSVSVTVSPSTAGSTATYTIKFVATSALSAGSGTITFDAHTGAVGTVFPATASDYVITDSTHSSGSGTVTAAPTLTNSNATVVFKVPKAITAGDSLSVAVSGVTNPSTANSSATLAVSTSANTTAVTSPAYAITNAADGSGTETVSPTTATAGATTTLSFTYTAAAGGLSSGSVAISVPSGWTAPTTTSGHAGYTTSSTGTVSVASQVVTVSGVSLTSGATLTVAYGSGGGANSVTVPQVAGAQSFATSEKSTSSGTLTALSSSPSVTISVSSDGSGTMTVSPSLATESVPTTLTFTYTAATGGLYAGAVTVTVPSGWSAPSTSSGHAGYTTSSTGSVSVASQVITVSGVTLAGGSTMTVAYGSGGGSNAAVPPSTSSENTFSVQEKSTTGGTLTSIGSSPQVNVIPPDGVGTMSVSPQSAIEAVPTTLVFTYTAASSGLSSGAVAVTVP